MAFIHHTTLTPGKLELLASWLPSQLWYDAAGGQPALTKAGGFRLDDPAGDVGIEFMVVTDVSGPRPASYHVPLTYRGSALAGAEHALIGQAEHGVLGARWVYDGVRDPVLLTQLVAFFRGVVQAQAQSVSDTPDLTVVAQPAGMDVTAADLRVLRLLEPGSADPATGTPGTPGGRGHVEGGWLMPDGTAVRGVLVVAQDASACRPV